MQKNRLQTAFRKVFDSKLNLNNEIDLRSAMALSWILEGMGVELTTNENPFCIEFGYVFSIDLAKNLKNNTNLKYELFSNEELEKINIIKESLSQYKLESLKHQVLQATACFSFLRTLACERIVDQEFKNLCPHYQALVKQAKITYNEIQNQQENQNNKNYSLQ